MRRKIYSTTDCKGYWYHARHGIGPGTIPRDVHLLKVVDDPNNKWKDYICLDRFLTTDELNEYDLKEECPPQIEASTSITASADNMTYTYNGHKYAVRLTEGPDENGYIRGTIQRLTNYDDADYVWASIKWLTVTFYQGTKKVDSMPLWAYDPDDELDTYVSDIIAAVCEELESFNKDINPVMVHY